MPRQPSLALLRATVTLLASSVAVVSLDAQSPTGIHYEYSISSDKGQPSSGSAYVLGDKSRIEMPQSEGEYIVLEPGHLFSIHPDKREYSDSPPEALSDVIGIALRATRMIVRFELSDVQVTAQDLGDGGIVAGHPTRHYRLVQRFSVTVHPLIVGSTDEPPEKNEVVTDYWVATDLQLPRNPLVDLVASAPAAIAQQDRDFARRTATVRDSLFTGTPLEIRVTTRKKSEHPARAVLFEITTITRVPLSRSLFEIPAGYRRTEGFSMESK
jgi:hypothetical protein